jgi:hypothetical protein
MAYIESRLEGINTEAMLKHDLVWAITLGLASLTDGSPRARVLEASDTSRTFVRRMRTKQSCEKT